MKNSSLNGSRVIEKEIPYKPSSFKSQPSMASSRSKNNSYLAVPVFLSAFLAIGLIGLLAISSNKRRNLKYGVSLEMVNVVNEFPHDPEAFTQGLLYAENDTLFESTGIYGRSSVRKVALRTGKVELLHKMDSSSFGEGLTLLGERLFQVTWLQNIGFIYDRNNLSQLGKFTNPMEDGWGLATDGKDLFGSDESSTLYQIDPQTFEVISKQVVNYNGHEVHLLNELEFVNGEVWANVYGVDCIARISPKDGKVVGWILLQNLRAELLTAGNNGIDVLNGIAWDGEQNRIFVTGKLWPKLYEIKPYTVKKTFEEGIIEKLCSREPPQIVRS